MNDVAGCMTVYAINDILSLFMMFRVLAILRILITNSTYYGNSAKRIWYLLNNNSSINFIDKVGSTEQKTITVSSLSVLCTDTPCK